ncbi:hypothetical protein FSP39_019097 [Pinctada imbricata]|uniref:Tyr recombinase domain-containing protein n=1 Tax=Pinctada imbricata TaxID=66713 RepID=A0AA88Y7J2_PINIB|nr:hypothetical protein FSP39_019097 [Pinctada imbricata]
MASKGLSYSTVKCYLAGISFNLKLNNFTDPCQFFIVQKMLLGLKRTKNVKDVRSPITLPLLNQLLNALPHVSHNYYEYILFAVAYCLAFFSLLRVGEITLSNAQTSYDPLRLENIVLEPSHLIINILRSKTDQAGKGTRLQVNRNSDNQPLFSCLHAYIEIRPQCAGQFLCHVDSTPLTYSQFQKVLKKALAFIKIDTSTFKSHSFRIGAATQLFLTGATEAEIKSKGRWRSNSYKTYIRPESIIM